jgi:hypothetical protein
MAPHLIRPLRFVLPLDSHHRSAAPLRLGFHLRYDWTPRDFAAYAQHRSRRRCDRRAAPRPTVRLGDYYGPEPRKLATEAIENVAQSPSLVPNAAG